MNANPILANSAAIAKTLLVAINADASLEHRAVIASTTSMNVSVILVVMEPLVSTESTDTLATVCQDSPDNIARLTLTNVPAIPAQMEVTGYIYSFIYF
jgi:uncharacterized protein (DUF2336 family)